VLTGVRREGDLGLLQAVQLSHQAGLEPAHVVQAVQAGRDAGLDDAETLRDRGHAALTRALDLLIAHVGPDGVGDLDPGTVEQAYPHWFRIHEIEPGTPASVELTA